MLARDTVKNVVENLLYKMFNRLCISPLTIRRPGDVVVSADRFLVTSDHHIFRVSNEHYGLELHFSRRDAVPMS